MKDKKGHIEKRIKVEANPIDTYQGYIYLKPEYVGQFRQPTV